MSESNNPSIPSEVVDAFQSAAITTLQELTQIEAFPDPAASKMELPSGQVVLAAIRLLRPVPGTMTLVLSADTAAQLAARYLPEGTYSDEMIDDVAGEFANVIAGQAKTILKGTRYHFRISTPAVTRPDSLAPSPVAADAKLAASLTSDLGRVLLLVDLLPCTNA